MRKHLLLLLLCVISAGSMLSQATLPDTFRLKTDTVEWQKITGPYLQVLPDTSGKWTIADITHAPLAEQLRAGTLAENQPEKLSNTYWFRYLLKNDAQRELRISLNSMSDYDDFYVQNGIGNQKHFVSGKLNEWEKKDGLKRVDCIPVTLVPGEVLVVYQQVRNKKAGLPAGFVIAVVSTDKILEQYYIREGKAMQPLIFSTIHVLEGFIIGFLLFSSVFNLFYFGVVRERVYLYFSLFLFFLTVNRCWNIYNAYNSAYNPALLRFLPLLSIAWIFIQFFLYRFVRSFFKVKQYFPKWDKALRWLSALAIVAMLSNVVLVPLVNGSLASLFRGLGSISFVIIFLPLLITLLLFLPQARQPGFVRLMVIGSLPYIAWNLFTAAIQLFDDEYSAGSLIDTVSRFSKYYFRPIEVICMSCFVLFSSRILFLRYGQLQKEHIEQVLVNERLAREKEVERNQLIEQQKTLLEKQVEERTRELKSSLENLKATQSQLVQAEKMASLGELTAGIAHEIQNPLNFVNNFSEINIELVEELKREYLKGKVERDEELQSELIEDIAKNSEKINHHGKRADAIVKGMLQHSRNSSATKEPADINKLTDEYLRLAYHGLRAKDKSFNATLKTEYDETIGNISIIAQDIGRVILNIITNAFYATNQRKVKEGKEYEPRVTVSTRANNAPSGGRVVDIKVSDNGGGIPTAVVDKIFQPFFTTKPTGQGTGLGLSLAYDIVKAHGGVLKVETKEGEGTTFIIQLPA